MRRFFVTNMVLTIMPIIIMYAGLVAYEPQVYFAGVFCFSAGFPLTILSDIRRLTNKEVNQDE